MTEGGALWRVVPALAGRHDGVAGTGSDDSAICHDEMLDCAVPVQIRSASRGLLALERVRKYWSRAQNAANYGQHRKQTLHPGPPLSSGNRGDCPDLQKLMKARRPLPQGMDMLLRDDVVSML